MMLYPASKDGLTPFRLISAADDNATVIKAARGCLYGLTAINTSDTLYYLKVYNKAEAPTEADTPVFTFPIPAAASGNGFILPAAVFGSEFDAGISLRITAGYADDDEAACAAGVVFLNGSYK